MVNDALYMKHKMSSIIKSSQPTRLVQQLARPVNTYKPIAMHRVDVEFEQKKKSEGKKSRGDRDKVMDSLFAAFEKHQYYNIKDLERITKQPIVRKPSRGGKSLKNKTKCILNSIPFLTIKFHSIRFPEM